MSLEEFLESCRTTSLLAELEDDEELPDADDDDNDDDDPNDDDDEYDEPYADDDGFETPNHVSGGVTGMVTSVSVSGTSAGTTGSANPRYFKSTSYMFICFNVYHNMLQILQLIPRI